jgi:glycosyltransferase involved in cell wall biosynthesis
MSESLRGSGASFFDESRRRAVASRHLQTGGMALFRKRVWRHLPLPLRKALLRLFFAWRRKPLAIGAPAVQPICVAGLLSTTTGMGEGARLCGRALAALGYDVRSVDVSPLLSGTRRGGTKAPPLEKGPGTVVLHFNPDHLPAILTLMGRKRLRGKRIVGYWAWELSLMPQRWLPALPEVDEIWTPSRFVADAVRPFTDKPVRVVAHPAALIAPAARGPRGTAPFTVLTMFSFASSFERKNPVAAVQAFRRAFGDASDRQMIVKASDGAEAPDHLAELLEAIGDAPNIRIESRPLGESERLAFIAGADVFLSLHRSEGFGLILAEAMLAGVAVVATAWSGNLEFMDEETALLVPVRMVQAQDARGIYGGAGECWAEPDVAAAAEHLRSLAEQPERFAKMRRAGKAVAQERLGLEAFQRAVEPLLGSATDATPGEDASPALECAA